MALQQILPSFPSIMYLGLVHIPIALHIQTSLKRARQSWDESTMHKSQGLSPLRGVAAGRQPSAELGWAPLLYGVGLLTVVYSFAFVDRQIFNILVGSIKGDLGITDMQISYLLGPAFILSYVTLGIPAGWCADRFNRRNLIIIAGVAWSLGTMSAAFVTTYGGLFSTRIFVGASEAFLFPAGVSYLADLFDRPRLPIGTSIFTIAPALGGGLSLLVGGNLLASVSHYEHVAIPLLGAIRGWQVTLLVIGLVGLLPVLLMFTLKEPARRRADVSSHSAKPEEEQFGFVEGLVYMLRRWRFYFAFFFGMACSSMVMLTVSAWAPSYLSRTFGLDPAQIGSLYGTLALVLGIAGGVASPLINNWLARTRSDSPIQTVRLGPCFLLTFSLLFATASNQDLALVCLGLLTFSYNFPMSMASTALQIATPPRLRGMASAYYFVIVSLVGYGLGPVAVPLVAAHVLHDINALGLSMAIISSCFACLSLALLSVAVRGYRDECAKQAQA
jgi:MFS family permease